MMRVSEHLIRPLLFFLFEHLCFYLPYCIVTRDLYKAETFNMDV